MSDRRKVTALDGFQLHPVTLRPNNGMEVMAYATDSALYVLRVDSRLGRVTVSWDGRTVFDSGVVTPLGEDA